MGTLDQLDKLLSETLGSKRQQDIILNDPDYVVAQEQFKKTTAILVETNVNYIAEKVCGILEEQRHPEQAAVFRLCSIGSGNGKFDKLVLEKILLKFPERKFHYVGLDIMESSCQQARDLLQSSPRLTNVTVEIHNRCIQKLDAVSAIEPCDVVICVHTLYYMTSLGSALKNSLSLMKRNGKMIIVNVRENPFNELFRHFWLHENKTQVQFAENVMEEFQKMGIDYKTEFLKCSIDLTPLFKDGFQDVQHHYVLDFIAQTRLKAYPPSVTQACIDYLSSIAYGKPERFMIDDDQFIITVNGMNSKESTNSKQ